MVLITMVACTPTGNMYFDYVNDTMPVTVEDINKFKDDIVVMAKKKKAIIIHELIIINITPLEKEMREIQCHVSYVANTSDGMFFKDSLLSHTPTNKHDIAVTKRHLKDSLCSFDRELLVLDVVIMSIIPLEDK